MPLKLHQDELPTINLTSMIDVLFLLIIFFMVGTKFAENENKVQINVPKVADRSASSSKSELPTITLLIDGTVDFSGQRMTIDGLRQHLAQLKQSNPNLSVNIAPDTECRYGQIFEAMMVIRSSGVHLAALNGISIPNRARR